MKYRVIPDRIVGTILWDNYDNLLEKEDAEGMAQFDTNTERVDHYRARVLEEYLNSQSEKGLELITVHNNQWIFKKAE